MSTPADERGERFAFLLDAALDEILARPTSGCTDDELLEELQSLERARRRIEAAGHQRLLEIDRRGVAQERMRRSTPALLVELLRISPAEARRRAQDADNLGVRTSLTGQTAGPMFPELARLHETGDISAEHVRVVTRMVDRLPDEIAAEHGEAAEATLATLATQFHPGHLAILARRVEAHLNPDGTYKDEAEQQRRRGLRLAAMPDGTGRLEGWLTAECLALWQAIVDPLAAPAPGDEPDSRTPPQRMHDALLTAGQILLRSGLTPDSAGVTTTVQVTMTAEQMRDMIGMLEPANPASAPGGSGVRSTTRLSTGGSARVFGCPQYASTAHGGVLTLGQACRMLADAEILPVFLSDTGGILAYGRERRLATRGQRRALAARDRGCSFPGCTAPPTWCEIHHVIPWRDLGETDIDNLTLLCPFHHRVFEARGWTVAMVGGVPWWTPPQWLDRTQIPRKNTANHLDGVAITAALEIATSGPPWDT